MNFFDAITFILWNLILM